MIGAKKATQLVMPPSLAFSTPGGAGIAQVVVRDLLLVGDGRPGVEVVEEELQLLVLHRPAAVGQERAISRVELRGRVGPS